jgi:hypothetical protein
MNRVWAQRRPARPGNAKTDDRNGSLGGVFDHVEIAVSDLAAIVTADAFDRHVRAQQRRVGLAEGARRHAVARVPTIASGSRRIPAGGTRWNVDAPERPTQFPTL